MTRAGLTLLALMVALLPTGAGAITAEQARTMPLAELARNLLGEAGSLMVEVDRPRFDGVLEDIRFYGRAVGAGIGMCSSDWVTVGFDERGKVNKVSAQRRYGVVGALYRYSEAVRHPRLPAACSSIRSTKSFFPAPDGAEHDIARYVDAVAGHGPFGKQHFHYRCSGACARDRGDLGWLKLEEIDASRSIDCPPSRLERPSCFELTVGEHRAGAFPKRFRIYGTTFANRVVVSDISVDVGSTLE